MRSNRSLTAALFVSTSIAVVSFTLAQRCEAQDVKQQQQQGQTTGQKPDPKGDPKTEAKGDKKAVCLSAAQQRELLELQIQDRQLDIDAEDLQREYNDRRAEANDLQHKVKYFGDVMDGKFELSDDEKAQGLKPAEEKTDAEADLKRVNQEIEKALESYKSKRIQQQGVKVKIEKLEKIKNGCDDPPQTAGGQNPPAKNNPPNTPPAGKCQNAADADLLAEYRRLAAYYEKDAQDIQVQLKRIDEEVADPRWQQKIDAEVKQAHLNELSNQRADLNKRYLDDMATVEKFKGLIKAILDKKPCPEEKKTTGYVPRVQTESFVSLENPGVPVVTVSLIGRGGEREHRHEHGRVERRSHEHGRLEHRSPEGSRLGRLHEGGRGGHAMGGLGHSGGMGGMGRMGGMGHMGRR